MRSVATIAIMAHSSEQFVVDASGNKVGVLLSIDEYQQMLEMIDELDAIQAYDAAKASGEEAIPFEQAVQEIERDRR